MEKLLNARQVSELLEVKVSTVYDWAHRGVIPYVKLGRLIRFKKAEIFQWVNFHTIRPKSSGGLKKASLRPPNRQREFPLAEWT